MVGYDRDTRNSYSRDTSQGAYRDTDRRDTRGYMTDRRRDLEDLQRFEDDGGPTMSGREYDRDVRGRRRDAEPIDPRGYGNAGGSEAGWSGYGNAGRSETYRSDAERGRDAERSHPGSYEFHPGSRYGRLERDSWQSNEGDRAESWTHGSSSPYRRDEGPGYGSDSGRGGYRTSGGFGSSFGSPTGSYGSSFGGSAASYGSNPSYGAWPQSARERPWMEQGAREWHGVGADSGSRAREAFGESRYGGSREMQGYRGKGPKGYTRSDTRIEEDVNDCLTEDPNIDASMIEVSVKGGEVTLSGTVARREDKRHAEDAIERVSGVIHVQNNLRVKREDSTTSGSASTTSSSLSSGAEKRGALGSSESSRGSTGSSKTT